MVLANPINVCTAAYKRLRVNRGRDGGVDEVVHVNAVHACTATHNGLRVNQGRDGDVDEEVQHKKEVKRAAQEGRGLCLCTSSGY